MGRKLYVGNLNSSISSGSLRSLFAPYGEVASASVAVDHSTGLSKGFGFVEMATDQQAKAAIGGLGGREHAGRALIVNEARPPAKHRDSDGRSNARPTSKHGGTGRDNLGGGPRRMFFAQ